MSSPTVLIKQPDGTTILRETRTPEELGREEAILTAANMKIDLRARARTQEMRVKSLKASNAARIKSAAMNQRAAKVARIKAKQDREARVRESENVIRNLLNRGLQPSEIRQLFQSLEEVDRNYMTWKYIDSHVKSRVVVE